LSLLIRSLDKIEIKELKLDGPTNNLHKTINERGNKIISTLIPHTPRIFELESFKITTEKLNKVDF